MRHRHSGKYRSRTPRGRIAYKQKPIHKLSRRKPVRIRRKRRDLEREDILESLREAENIGEAEHLQEQLDLHDEQTEELNKEAMEFIESEDVEMDIPSLPRKEFITPVKGRATHPKWKFQDEADDEEYKKYWQD